MLRKSKKMVSIACVVLSLAVASGMTACKKDESADAGKDGEAKGKMLQIDAKTVATIGNHELKDYEYIISLESEKNTLLAGEKLEAGSEQATAFLNGEADGAKRIDTAKKNALNAAKQFGILLSMAKDDNLYLTQAEVDAVNDGLKAEIEKYEASTSAENPQAAPDQSVPQTPATPGIAAKASKDKDGTDAYKKAEEEFQKTVLSPYKLTVEQYTALMQSNKLTEKFYQTYTDKVEITPEELNKKYDEVKDTLETATVKHVLLMNEGTEAKKRTKEESKALAEEVLKKLNAGEDMEKLVTEYSEDNGAATNKGEYTFTKNDSYVQSFKDWAFAAKDGDTGIVESEYGYHVMKFISRQPKPLADVKDDLTKFLRDQKFEEMITAAEKDAKYEPVINHEVYDAIN